MKYRIFGRSGLRVSELCLGTMTFGEETGFGAPREESRKMYDTFLEAGGNFIDTANMYSRGTSERMLGEFISSDRERIVLATKYSNNMVANDPNAGGNHRKNMVQALEGSLKRLNTEYIDLFWVHIWDFTTPVVEVMRALDDLVRSGKVLHVGISNAPAWIVAWANALAEERGWTPFSGMQLHYNLVERSIEDDFMPLAKAQDMAITPWSPLAGGLLTGKFNRDADESAREGSRLATSRWGSVTEEKITVAEKVSEVAAAIGCTPSQVALNWLRQSPGGNVIPIIGARNVKQLEDNLGCLECDLAPEHRQALDEASAISPRYPASLLTNPFVKRMIHGEMGDLIDNHHDVR